MKLIEMSERRPVLFGLLLGLVCSLVAVILVGPVPAHATEVTQFTWDRTGSEHLPCAGSVEWLLSPGTGLLDATVGINDADGVDDGHAYGMQYAWTTETFYITTTEALQPSDEVLVAFTGEAVTQPTLSLVDCTQAVTEPSTLPTTNPPSTPPTESQPVPALTTYSIGFRVRTHVRTNVVAKYRIACVYGGVAQVTKGRVRGMTPLSRTFDGFEGADSCHIVVRAYDIKPWNGPHGNGQTPIVNSWVEAV